MQATPDEMLIRWGEPEMNEGSGIWSVKIENLQHRTLDAVYKHEICKGSFVFPNPNSGKAWPVLDSLMVKQYGAWRCWWLLREEITERVVLPNEAVDGWITAALESPNEWLEGDQDENGDDDETYGRIDWIRN